MRGRVGGRGENFALCRGGELRDSGQVLLWWFVNT